MGHDDETAPAGALAPSREIAPEADLEALEARTRRARGAGEADPLRDAEGLVALEADVLTLARTLTERDPDLADDRGRPLLAELGRWRAQCESMGLARAAARATELSDELLEDEAVRWRAAAAEAARQGPGACFDALAEATVLDQEALARRGARRAPPLLSGDRAPTREAFVDAIERAPPTDQRRDAWVTDLLDRADVVLTGIDDLTPAAATAQLELVIHDLAWHRRHVERRRSPRRRKLRRKLRRLRAERQERQLQGRLERLFGARNVGRFERLIIGLIFLVLALLAVEPHFDPEGPVVRWIVIADTLACLVFLWDFFFRLWLVKGKWRWFLRHALVDLLPSIPFGLLVLLPAGQREIRAGRALRFLRLTRVARHLRLLLPVIRIFRALGFLARGVDRIVRRYGHLLNRDVILYPTREEKARALAAIHGTPARLRRLQAEVNDLWEDLLLSTDGAERETVAAARLDGLDAARAHELTRRPPPRRVRAAATREIPAEALLHRLEAVTAEGVEAELGPDFVSRVARIARLFSRPPLRWIPFLGGWFPRLGPRMGNAEVTAAAANHAAGRLRVHLDRWFWFADLYGTVTPAEFVDRVGTTMVRGAFRPAYRLALFGGVFLLAQGLLLLLPWDPLNWVALKLGPLVGDTLLVLGGICVLILAVGWWLRRVAQRATAFYEQVALAQFLPLTESIKGRFLARDAALLSLRVLGPESLLRGEAPQDGAAARQARFVEGVKAWLLEAHAGGDARGAFDAMERVVLLHRDGLDGGLFHTSDTRTTNQLLGNPALRHLRRSARCVSRRERKELRALDLEHQRRLLGGPYFWFGLVTRAVAQSTAHLIVRYNRHAIPLCELTSAHPRERERLEAWLAGRRVRPRTDTQRRARTDDSRYVTAAFSALHFLDDDERRDRDVERRFGPRVLERLRIDRRRLVRRIFGTYPLHMRPHEERVVNLYRTYENWLAGGRALLLPLRGLWAAVKWIARVIGWVVQAVQQIRRPPPEETYEKEAEADFATAVRKIDRMRGPVVRACLWLRTRMDPEYLGVRLPGTRRTGLEGATVERDLEFLDAPAPLRRAVEAEHDRAQADMRRLARLIEGGLLKRIARDLGLAENAMGREHLRGAAFAYRADINGVRSLLSASDILRETLAGAGRRPGLRPTLWPRLRLRRAFRAWWRKRGRGGRRVRRAVWRSAVADVNGSGRALRMLSRHDPGALAQEGERRLRELLRHPGRLSGQLVTLRAVQTLALLDVLTYRAHVWRLGEYAHDGEEPGALLTLDGEPTRVEADAVGP